MNENSFIFKYAVYDLECSVKKPVGAFKTLAEAKRFAREVVAFEDSFMERPVNCYPLTQIGGKPL